MRLLAISECYREYKTDDGQYHVKWHDGGHPDARSWYAILEIRSGKTGQAHTVKGVRKAISQMCIAALTGGTAPQIGDTLYLVAEDLNTWQLRTRQVTRVRINGFLLDERFGKIQGWELLDTLYHRTADAAIAAFIAAKRKNIDARTAANIVDERAIDWAKGL